MAFRFGYGRHSVKKSKCGSEVLGGECTGQVLVVFACLPQGQRREDSLHALKRYGGEAAFARDAVLLGVPGAGLAHAVDAAGGGRPKCSSGGNYKEKEEDAEV